MGETVKERLLSFIDYSRLNKAKFAEKAKLSGSFVNNIYRSIHPDSVAKIKEAFPELNTEWLLHGTGEMLNTLKSEEDIEKEGMIPVLPLALVGMEITSELSKLKNCEKIFCPIESAEFAIKMAGSEMFPIIPDGAYIILKERDINEPINYGKVYVLDTPNGTIVRFLYPSENEENVMCVSAADAFPTFEVKKSRVSGIYQAMAVIQVLSN